MNAVRLVLPLSLIMASLTGPVFGQVLNTRPLTQPYINPSNPNAGTFGSQTSVGTKQLTPQQQFERRQQLQNQTSGQQVRRCSVDSSGVQRCTTH
jgi:hypothetical protein